jgi:hypothetical protein
MEADTRPYVQSILTADTLIRHYVRAVEAVRRSLGRDELEMSAQIGDANRTYPTIWEHLEHARALLAAEGRDTSAFDRLRERASGQTAVGIDSDRSEIGYSLFSSSAYQTQTLTLHFNLRGVSLAHEASQALKQALPDVQWDALERDAAAPPPDLKGSRAWVYAVVIAGAVAAALVRYLISH